MKKNFAMIGLINSILFSQLPIWFYKLSRVTDSLGARLSINESLFVFIAVTLVCMLISVMVYRVARQYSDEETSVYDDALYTFMGWTIGAILLIAFENRIFVQVVIEGGGFIQKHLLPLSLFSNFISLILVFLHTKSIKSVS